MNPATQAIDQAVAKEADLWAKLFLKNRIAHLERQNIKGSGNLIRSWEYAMEKDPVGASVRLLVAFEGYGRIAEMKNVSHDKWGRNGIERLEEWVKAKGVDKFIAGWLKLHKKRTIPNDFVNRVAWGIAMSRTEGKFRRRKFYNEAKTGAINDLYNNVAAALPEPTLKTVKKQFDFKAYAAAKGR